VIRSYRDLVAWQKAMDLVQVVYGLTKTWPREELYALTPQVRRAVTSVPSNIAEGRGRGTAKEFLNHLNIAYGSLTELETQLLIAHRLKYVSDVQLEATLTATAEVGRLLNGLSRSLGRQRPPLTPDT
jgi:four helix bundle protein